MVPSLGELDVDRPALPPGSVSLGPAIDLEHDRQDNRDLRAIASWRSSSPPRPLGPWQTSSQTTYKSSSAASDVDLTRFDLRIIPAMQSSGRPRHDG
jgi:hypothetical protein